MTRMEAIRRQYEGNGSVRDAERHAPTGGRAYPTRPRNAFWHWFWLLFLVTLLIGFFSAKGTLAQWYARMYGQGHESTVVGKVLGTEKLAYATDAASKGVYQIATANGQVDVAALKAFVNPSMAELNQLCEYVRNSPNVRENAAYNEIMSSVQFVYPAENNLVNAFASLAKLDEKSDKMTRVIVFLGGAARFARISSLAVALELSGERGAGKRFLNALQGSDLAKFDDEVAVRIIRQANLAGALTSDAVLSKARSVSAGLMLGIIAHEAGHQALNHTLNQTEVVNLEISRNQEREADSFSSSVIATSPFGEYILVGTLFWHYALAMQQGDTAVATTHPLSKERFENFVRANADLAASMGITLPTAAGSAAK